MTLQITTHIVILFIFLRRRNTSVTNKTYKDNIIHIIIYIQADASELTKKT